jgi:hypothetical protein
MDNILDIFNDDAFSTVKLTDAINEVEYAPGRLGEMGLFTETSVDTITVAVETKGNTIIVVPPTPRGGPGTTVGKKGRKLMPLSVPHFEINDAIMAEEVQSVRGFGRGRQLETVGGKIAERQLMHVQSMGVTQEKSRLGAVSGIVVYEDGSHLDLFAAFDVSQINEIAFDLGSNVDGKLRRTCAGITRTISNELGGIPFRGIHALCGDNFFDDLLANPEFRETYKGWSQAQILREAYIGPNRSTYGIVEFGGIVFENYRGSTGLGVEVPTDKCQLFPVGVPGLFRSVAAPADYVDTVNTMGKRLYNHRYLMANKKGVHFDVQMNTIEYCTRPRVLLKGKRGA